ncbi:phosphonatase-like hydrolase [Deminuibacter soli]|uniref:Phosphonatase-like hydrolase n=1 Tax=Deminuibacter soli TaxID=2291815 RepID=A0A3E1NPB3_9BACT|nr:phosphonatase-like hydrolase [Deminuibacter soli]RFM29775.1 phosphonatase-like hydrolase [Deminuibacter soli]
MIKMVVFDMAGTTVDEDNVVYKTVQRAINEQGYDFTLEEVLEAGAGKEKLQAIKDVLALKGVQDEALAQVIFKNFAASLDEAYRTMPIKEQPGAGQLFQALKERKIFVVLNTGYSRPVAESLITKIGWQVGRDIDALVTATDVPRNRPHPDMIWFAMEQLGVPDATLVAKVGDSAIDIAEGINAGCLVNVGITTGAQTRQQLLSASPAAVIDNLLELLPLVITATATA